jgi:hypothetical protein
MQRKMSIILVCLSSVKIYDRHKSHFQALFDAVRNHDFYTSPLRAFQRVISSIPK